MTRRNGDALLEIGLIAPQIPPNTGNIARLCAATRSTLHLIGPLPFSVSDRAARRAGLDYWSEVILRRWEDWEGFQSAMGRRRLLFFETGPYRSYTEAVYRSGDVLLFGQESRGLPQRILSEYGAHLFTIPIYNPKVRSLNLANAVSIVLYEALRQIEAAENAAADQKEMPNAC
ncbi:tRNA (cytidine(34)-2'-O)-methyltransferase [Methylacidimicrobium cyclopophantes]|uniref:Putative tRNA (cytidine(34)-2'-O)-methyltransferase n=1 Tax=Methylacidimicrobium cyclopophantes TaxID=1041766 RepID=A0A5E6MBS0_9BACT|nr:tRNA (cytidine(34)-2'-O)-methyltransferase [Methylacidimicrobium cyclopophantes]VVM06678.1 tRNA (cytidine(34)-2'-O)-methyltransferase [Methylacidimicrobium cyclopophantes]